MNSTIHKINLDIHRMGAQVTIPMWCGDTERTIVITLMEKGKLYRISEGCTAKFSAKKPDGNYIYSDCIVDYEKNTISYNIGYTNTDGKRESQTTARVGEVECQITLIGKDGGAISTPSFSIVVSPNVYDGQDILESTNEYNIIASDEMMLSVKDELAKYQPKLEYDTEPTLNSENLVKSGGIYGWTIPQVYNCISQDYITMNVRSDEVPTEFSHNFVTSGGLYNAFQKNNFEVICSGELDDTNSGVASIQAEILADISNISELKFYIEYPTKDLTAGSTLYLNAHINGIPASKNTFWTITSSSVIANTTQRACCFAKIFNTPNGKMVFGVSSKADSNNGINTRVSPLSCICNWDIPTNTALYLNINNTVAFPSGTKWILEAR